MGVSASAVRAGNASVELNADDSKFTAVMNRAERRFNRLVGTVKQAGSVAASVGVGTLAAMTPAVMTFSSFDDVMLAVKAKTQATEREFEALRAKALELAGASGFTATEVGRLMAELGTAGFNPSDVEKMTGAVLQLARATGTTAENAASLLGTVTKQFKLTADDAGRLADQLTQAANKSAVTAESLIESFAYLGPVAHTLKATTDEMLALVGVLGEVGIKGSEAGTALRRLQLIAADGDKLDKLFGVSGTDAAGKVRPLIDVMADVQAAMRKMTDAERIEKLTAAFGILGVTSAAALADSTKDVRTLHAAILDSNGVARETAGMMDSGLGGTWRRLKGDAEKLSVALGDALAPALGFVGSWAGFAALKLTEFVTANREAVGAAVATAAAALGVAAAVKVVGVSLAVVASPVTAVAAAVGGLLYLLSEVAEVGAAAGGDVTAVLVGATAAAVGLVVAVKVLAAAVAVLTSPVTAVAALVGGLIYTFVRFTETGQRMAAGLVAAFRDVGKFFREMFGGIAAAVGKGDLQLAWDILLKGLQVGWLALVEVLRQRWYDFANFFRDTFNAAILGVQKFGLKVVLEIQAGFLDAILTAADALNRAHAALRGPPDRAERQAAEAKVAPELAAIDKERAAVRAEVAKEATTLQEKAAEMARIQASDSPFKDFGLAGVRREQKEVEARVAALNRQLDALDARKKQVLDRAALGPEFIDTSALRSARSGVAEESARRVADLERLDREEREARNKGQQDRLDAIRKEREAALAEMRELIRRANVEVAPMPREVRPAAPGRGYDDAARMAVAGGVGALLPMKAQQLGESVRGVFQSADYRGVLGIGGPAKNYAADQLKATEEIATVLRNDVIQALGRIERKTGLFLS